MKWTGVTVSGKGIVKQSTHVSAGTATGAFLEKIRLELKSKTSATTVRLVGV